MKQAVAVLALVACLVAFSCAPATAVNAYTETTTSYTTSLRSSLEQIIKDASASGQLTLPSVIHQLQKSAVQARSFYTALLDSVFNTNVFSSKQAKSAPAAVGAAAGSNVDPFDTPDGYFRWIPVYTASLVNSTQQTWSAPCFKNNEAYVVWKDNKPTLQFYVNQPTSLFCSDSYLIATMESIYLKTIFFRGSHSLEWTFSSDATPADIADTVNNGFRVFRFPDNPIDTITEILQTAELFVEPLTHAHIDDNALAANLQFLSDYAKVYMPRRFYQVTIDPATVNSGDFLGILRPDGLDPMLAWAMGAHTGHTAIALWMEGELFVCESTVNSSYWPTNGIQRTPWNQWIAQAKEANYNVVLLPLSDEAKAKFNVTKAVEFFNSVKGLPYGFHNMFFGWIDMTDNSNFPGALSNELVQIITGIADKILPTIGESMFNEALNMRLNTTGLKASEIAVEAHKRGMTFIEVGVLPEQDSWVYSDGPSMVCDVFVCMVYKSAGLFGDMADDIQCGEMTNWDVYSLNFFKSSFSDRPLECQMADPDLPYCQIVGDYRMYMPGFNTKAPYRHMTEKCPSKAPNYERPSNC